MRSYSSCSWIPRHHLCLIISNQYCDSIPRCVNWLLFLHNFCIILSRLQNMIPTTLANFITFGLLYLDCSFSLLMIFEANFLFFFHFFEIFITYINQVVIDVVYPALIISSLIIDFLLVKVTLFVRLVYVRRVILALHVIVKNFSLPFHFLPFLRSLNHLISALLLISVILRTTKLTTFTIYIHTVLSSSFPVYPIMSSIILDSHITICLSFFVILSQ